MQLCRRWWNQKSVLEYSAVVQCAVCSVQYQSTTLEESLLLLALDDPSGTMDKSIKVRSSPTRVACYSIYLLWLYRYYIPVCSTYTCTIWHLLQYTVYSSTEIRKAKYWCCDAACLYTCTHVCGVLESSTYEPVLVVHWCCYYSIIIAIPGIPKHVHGRVHCTHMHVYVHVYSIHWLACYCNTRVACSLQ